MAEQNDRTTLGTAEWGRGFVEELARETLKEKRAKRRWRIFLWLVFFALVGFSVQRCTEVGGNRMQGGDKQPAQFVATISLDGVISGSEEEGVSASKVNRALRRAFHKTNFLRTILGSRGFTREKVLYSRPVRKRESPLLSLGKLAILFGKQGEKQKRRV